MIHAAFTKRLGLERQRAAEKLVKQHAQRIDVRTGVNVLRAHLGLFRTHVLGRPDKLAQLGIERPVRQGLRDSFGNTEINNLDGRFPVLDGHQNVRRFDVPVNNAFLVGVLNALTRLQK